MVSHGALAFLITDEAEHLCLFLGHKCLLHCDMSVNIFLLIFLLVLLPFSSKTLSQMLSLHQEDEVRHTQSRSKLMEEPELGPK